MASEVQRQAEELFHRVVELGDSERQAYLEMHGQNPAVRKELDELLRHADRTRQTLSGAFSAEVESCLDGDPDGGRDGATEAPAHSGGGRWESVLEVLAGRDGPVSQISLRDILGDDSPIVRPIGSDKPELPERIGRYQVSGEIARGGVGSVWKARDVELGREIALKVLLDRQRKSIRSSV